MCFCPCITDEIISSIVQNSTLLECISLAGCSSINGQCLAAIENYCTHLRFLSMESCDNLRFVSLESDSITYLNFDSCPKLETIKLHCTSLKTLCSSGYTFSSKLVPDIQGNLMIDGPVMTTLFIGRANIYYLSYQNDEGNLFLTISVKNENNGGKELCQSMDRFEHLPNTWHFLLDKESLTADYLLFYFLDNNHNRIQWNGKDCVWTIFKGFEIEDEE